MKLANHLLNEIQKFQIFFRGMPRLPQSSSMRPSRSHPQYLSQCAWWRSIRFGRPLQYVSSTVGRSDATRPITVRHSTNGRPCDNVEELTYNMRWGRL